MRTPANVAKYPIVLATQNDPKHNQTTLFLDSCQSGGSSGFENSLTAYASISANAATGITNGEWRV